MLKRTCVQCGKEFEMNQSEINFYKKKKLSLPKRCKECREMNKSAKKEKTEEEEKKLAQQEDVETDLGYQSGTVSDDLDQSKYSVKTDIEKNGREKTGREKTQTERKGRKMTDCETAECETTGRKKTQTEQEKKESKMSMTKKRLAYLVAAAAIILGGGGTAISTLNDAPEESTRIEREAEDHSVATEENAGEIIEGENADVAAGKDQSVETTEKIVEETTEETTEKIIEETTEEIIEGTDEGLNELTEAVIVYEFRNQELLESHYKKHGIEMGFASPEEYLKAANCVIAASDVLHKTEAEDGDDVYYLEETNEFVIVSADGYIRTYFNPSDGIDYYNRQ